MGDGEGEPVGLPGVSDFESTMGKDFSSFEAADLAEVERLAAQIARRLATRRSRRLKPSRRRGPRRPPADGAPVPHPRRA